MERSTPALKHAESGVTAGTTTVTTSPVGDELKSRELESDLRHWDADTLFNEAR